VRVTRSVLEWFHSYRRSRTYRSDAHHAAECQRGRRLLLMVGELWAAFPFCLFLEPFLLLLEARAGCVRARAGAGAGVNPRMNVFAARNICSKPYLAA
jgi:hypothetical protein